MAKQEENRWKNKALVDRFNTHKALDEIHPDAAVNIYVGWPSFFEQIKYQKEFLGTDSLNILDYGCGAGEFAKKLCMLNHNVVGMDLSEEMLDIAKKNTKDVDFINAESLNSIATSDYVETFDVVTAMHSFDWIEDIEYVIDNLSKVLKQNGLLLFSIFPKEHVVESLEIGDLFENFDSNTDPKIGSCNFDGDIVPVFIRDSQYFTDLLEKFNFTKILEFLPPYPNSFLKKYNWTGAKSAEMLIFGFRKR